MNPPMHPQLHATSTPASSRPSDQPTAVPEADRMRAVIEAVTARHDRVTEETVPLWRAFRGVCERQQRDPRSSARCAVLANLVALAAFNDVADIHAVIGLQDQLGPERLARLQHRASLALESDPDLPWTTLTVGRLVSPQLPERLARSGASVHEVDRLVAVCRTIAHALLMQDIDPDQATIPLESALDFLDAVDHGSIVEWRAHLSAIAAHPWGPYPDQLLLFARESGRERSREMIESTIELCREWARGRERDQVANEIRRLVTVSGLSQRAFAARIGTSPSRLSSYISGSVTPSATILLRIQRMSRALQRDRVKQPARARVGGPRQVLT